MLPVETRREITLGNTRHSTQLRVFAARVAGGERVKEETAFGQCSDCERLKQSHSSAVNTYGEAVQLLGRAARGQDSKAIRENLRKATEECERTKLELLLHKSQCTKVK